MAVFRKPSHSALILLSLLMAAPVWAAAPTRSRTYTTGQTIEAGDVTTNEDNIFSYLQAGVDTYAVGTVNAAAIADDAVGSSEIAAGAVGASEIASGAVDAVDMITTGTIADDKAFVADSSTAGTWRTVPNCTDTGGNHLNYTQSSNSFSCGTSSNHDVITGTFTRDTSVASGTQDVTVTGITPIYCYLMVVQQNAAGEMSHGIDDGTTPRGLADDNLATADTWVTDSDSIMDRQSGAGTAYTGDITTFAANSFTITWTRTGTPTGTITGNFACEN